MVNKSYDYLDSEPGCITITYHTGYFPQNLNGPYLIDQIGNIKIIKFFRLKHIHTFDLPILKEFIPYIISIYE